MVGVTQFATFGLIFVVEIHHILGAPYLQKPTNLIHWPPPYIYSLTLLNMRRMVSFNNEEQPVTDDTRDIYLTAGPSQIWGVGKHRDEHDYLLGEIEKFDQLSHRSKEAKDLLMKTNELLFELFGIPEELRNKEFRNLNETPEGWHLAFTNSGSNGMAMCIRALCPMNTLAGHPGTVLVDTDNFSAVAAEEMKEFGRKVEVRKMPRGGALTPGSEAMEQLKQDMADGTIKTLYLTENATTNGAFQPEAVKELVQFRNHHQCDTVIIVDGVSSPILGRKFDPRKLPDAYFWAGQKHMGVGPGIGGVLFNNRALAREEELRNNGLDTGGKLGLRAAYGTNKKRMAQTGQTPQTPPLGLIEREWMILRNAVNFPDITADIAKHQREILVAFVEALDGGELQKLGFRPVTPNRDLQSPTSLVMAVPEGVSAKAVVEAVIKKEGVVLATGYGEEYADREIRIGAYSANTADDVHRALRAIGDATRDTHAAWKA